MNASGPASKPMQLVGLFPDLLGIGGIQEVSRQTVRALLDISAQNGWSASLLGLNDSAGVHELPAGENKITFRGFGRSKLRFILAALQIARKKPRVVLAAHANLAPITSWMKRLAPRTKIIVMAHGVEVWQPLPARRHAALLAADIALAASTSTVQKLTEVQQMPLEKIRKLPWPLDPEVLAMAGAPAKLPAPAAFPPSPVILTVGRWAASEQYKGVDDLVRALAYLRATFPSLTLAAVGAGDDLQRLQKLAADLGVAGEVRFLTGLSKLELAACYARADIFALPSTGEGFGLVFLEAMAFGEPLVAAACGGSTDVVQDGVNGLLVPPHDLKSLTEALSRLLENSALRMELGRRGAEIVRKQYSFEVFQNQLERIVEECGMDSVATG